MVGPWLEKRLGRRLEESERESVIVYTSALPSTSQLGEGRQAKREGDRLQKSPLILQINGIRYQISTHFDLLSSRRDIE